MERRTIIAFVLIGLITFVWVWRMNSLQKQRAEPSKPPAAEPEKAAPPTEASAAGPAEPAKPVAAKAPALAPASGVPLRDDILTDDPTLNYELVWSNRGACLREARLKAFHESLHSPKGVPILESLKDLPGTLALADPKGELPLDTQNYEVLESSASRIAFAATFANGLRVMKEYLPNPGRYDMRVRVTLKNAADQPRTIRYDIYAAARLTPDVTSEPELQGVLGSQIPNGGIRIVTKSPANVDKEPFQRSNSTEEPLLWGGASERYFAAVLSPVPQSGTTSGIIASATVQFLPQSESVTGSSGRVSRIDNVTVRFTTTERTLKPGQEIVDEYTYFVGPKKQDVLAAHPPLVGLLDYGVFGFISKALLGVLHAFYYVIPNYGIGIILLTIVVKVCLFPVTRKGQISMHKMQRLQPLVKELQEKHKDDRQRQGREMMDLYRKHNANPMSGCWPIFFQLPIFWGLFRMLQYSIDLRQASFLPWWITDLSQPDTVGHIAEFPINILPVLMVISWVVQQWTMPKPADPQQAQMQKMMMFMPVIFGFMLYGMAAGLTLYWLTSTFLGIVEQKLIKHQIQKMEERGQFSALTVEAAQAAKPAGRPKTKRK